MKIDFIKTFIALAVSALIAYGFSSFHHSENSQLLVFASFSELFLSSFLILGLRFELNRTTANVRTLASIFFVVFLLTNVVFSFVTFSQQLYVIINGILFLIGVLIVYSIIKVKQ
jgi:ABC-type glycerol-3-phosphate transport system permease component